VIAGLGVVRPKRFEPFAFLLIELQRSLHFAQVEGRLSLENSARLLGCTGDGLHRLLALAGSRALRIDSRCRDRDGYSGTTHSKYQIAPFFPVVRLSPAHNRTLDI
jgi:hypothetical protein